MDSNFRHLAEEIRREIEAVLARSGLLFRVFARGKDAGSLSRKLSADKGKYCLGGKMIQDAIGVRIVLYFEEDVSIVASLLESRFSIDRESSTVDSPATDQFTVSRHNLIFRLPDQHLADFDRLSRGRPIDGAFEVQLRTVLSEGWHEVDHDLRYKSPGSWNDHEDLSRALNGIFATLETADWGMRRIFDELAYRHYKLGNWAHMLHSRMRIRAKPSICSAIHDEFCRDKALAKEAFRIERREVINRFFFASPSLPVSLDNAVFIWNCLERRSEVIYKSTPEFLVEVVGALDRERCRSSASS